MPHLVQMDKKLREKGLVIIGAECQRSSNDKIKQVTDNAKVEFTITKGVSGPMKVRGIPVALVFDTKGKLIYKGHSSDNNFERTVKKALKDVVLEDEKASKTPEKSNQPLIAQRAWTNSEGKSITASVTQVNGKEVTFKLRNLKVVKYQLSKLSEADQTLIKQAVEDAAKETAEAE